MPDQLYRIAFKNASICGPIADIVVVTGYLVNFEPELPQSPPQREVLRPLDPNEPDPETEVGYSRNVLEPLTIIHKNKKAALTKTPFILFHYIYELYRNEGRTEFEFIEISDIIKGDELALTKNAIEKAIRKIAESLAIICSPISVRYNKEVLYIDAKQGSITAFL